MTNTSKEALVVFAENVENVDDSLSKLEGALEKQTDYDVSRELIRSMAGLQTIVADTNDQMVVELRALTQEMSESTQQDIRLGQRCLTSTTKVYKFRK